MIIPCSNNAETTVKITLLKIRVTSAWANPLTKFLVARPPKRFKFKECTQTFSGGDVRTFPGKLLFSIRHCRVRERLPFSLSLESKQARDSLLPSSGMRTIKTLSDLRSDWLLGKWSILIGREQRSRD